MAEVPSASPCSPIPVPFACVGGRSVRLCVCVCCSMSYCLRHATASCFLLLQASEYIVCDALREPVRSMRSWGLGGESVPLGLMRRMQEVRLCFLVLFACRFAASCSLASCSSFLCTRRASVRWAWCLTPDRCTFCFLPSCLGRSFPKRA